eukprot:CAMPEP_0177660164 /NCGR_PEP_ID=MMETSP0447-20121125/17863_1 /TAXON_ID=0 /ORGANISM="Stygamoeba regulata, Strain BSH-02190019" /LENGTH=215 /DNA_ID=CAMNT_0019165149 /DNA_START=27 /DNA_END=674 /DNA_ORIENTATION=+
MSTKCGACGKTAYPLESLQAGNSTYHKLCFKCEVCKSTLNVKNYKAREGHIYCHTHLPQEKATQVADSVLTKHATAAPKLNTQVGVSKGTGEKPNVGLDTVTTQSALKAPKREVEKGAQKGTDAQHSAHDTLLTQHALKAPKVNLEKGIQKGAGEGGSMYGADATFMVAASNAPKLSTEKGIRIADPSTAPETSEVVNQDGGYDEQPQEEEQYDE